MQPITIWHNPNCSKSRASMALLEKQNNLSITTFNYLETPPSYEALTQVLRQLALSPRELMRTKEDLYQELGLHTVTSNRVLIEAMCSHPKLIERPIIIKGERAVIARPIENLHTLLAEA